MRARWRSSLLLSCALLSLTGCDTIKNSSSKLKPATDTGISGALSSAAADAASAGRLGDSLEFISRMYQKDPKNPDNIVAYARALRRTGQLDDAKVVIQSVAESKNASLPIITEFANVLIAEGSYEKATTIAAKAVDRKAGDAYAQQALGLALSGMGKDAEAEGHFRTALLRWPESANKTPIINNLAMNLAAQGKLEDAKTVMALATGEALQSETYRNNRALLNTLKTEVPLTALPAVKVEKEELVANKPAAKSKKASTLKEPEALKEAKDSIVWEEPKTKKLNTRVKMKPIVQ